jgi:hypothetical protein
VRPCFYLPAGIRPYQEQPVARVLAFFAGVYRKPASPYENFSGMAEK